MILNNFYFRIYIATLFLVLLLGFHKNYCNCVSDNSGDSPKESFDVEVTNSELYYKKFSLLLYTICSEVISECETRKNMNTEINIKSIRRLSKLIIEDFDSCDKILTSEYSSFLLPFVGNSKINHNHNIAYEICCRIRSNISSNSELLKILNGSLKYLDLEDYVKTSMNTIDNFEDLSEKPISNHGLIYASTLDPHKGIKGIKDVIQELEDKEKHELEEIEDNEEDKGLIFSFDIKAAPFMHCSTHQYIYTYYHHLDNAKCLGLTIKQLEIVKIIQNTSINVKNVPRIPLDIACTAMWFISQRWHLCPYTFEVLAKLKKSTSIKFCEMIKRATPERNKYLTKSLSLSDKYLAFKAAKILRYIELVLKLNARYFNNSEITSKDIANIIYSAESDILIKEDEKFLYKELKKNRLQKEFTNSREFRKNNVNFRYPVYKKNRNNFTSVFDYIMYNGEEYSEDEGDNIVILPLEFRRSPDWTSEKHLGSYSKEVLDRKTVLQTYYIPPPSNFVPNDVSNWITGPCCWLKDKYKHIPTLIISISKSHGHNLHILNACEAVLALVNDSGDSCANILVSALFFSYSIENHAESSDICSETAIRSNLPFYPKKDINSTLFLTNQHDIILLYEGLIVALCLELGIHLEKEDIYQVIFSDYPHNNSLVPRMSLNHLLYRALKLPNDFGKVRNFWNWPTQMYTRISNKQARVILSQRITQLTLEIAQVTNEIEIMNDIIKKNKKKLTTSQDFELNDSNLDYKKSKNNYLQHFNYNFELTNIDSIELNLVKLERLRYDLISEKEKIKSYVYSLTKYIGHKIYDIPKKFTKNDFKPLYKPKVFKVHLYDTSRLQAGIITSRSTRNLFHLLDNKPINENSGEYEFKINYKIKRYYKDVKECSNLTDKGLDLAIFIRELLIAYLNIDIEISVSCKIILNMPPTLNIKDAFLSSSFSILNYKFEDIEMSDLEEIWLKIIPILSIPSGDLHQTKIYKFIDYNKNNYSECESDELSSEINSSQKSISEDKCFSNIEDSVSKDEKFTKSGYYKVPKSIKICNSIKKPKESELFPVNIIDHDYMRKFDNFWNKLNFRNEIEHNNLIDEEYRNLKRKISDINNELIQAYKNISPSNSSEKNSYYNKMIKILEKDKRKTISRINHLAGKIAETEVKNADLHGTLIPQNVRKLADLHRINSIYHAEILKLKSDDSGRDYDKRIRDLEFKINDNNTEMNKIIELEGNDLQDPRWYSDIEKCLSSYVPYRAEVHSVNPSEGFKRYIKPKHFYIDSKNHCTKVQLDVYKYISKDLKRLFSSLNIAAKVTVQRKKLEMIENTDLIDPRRMEYWQNLHGIMYENNKKACSYLKKFVKSIFPIKDIELKEFIGSPVFILWCANHVKSRLGNEDIWRNIVGLIWLIFYSKPFKPKDFVWKNILLA